MQIKYFILTLFSLILLALPSLSLGQSPFGVDLPSSPARGQDGSLWGELLSFIAAQQSAFYQALTESISDMKADGTAFLALVGLSFMYGVLHAAGPGHGKVIMSSYVLANKETARRGAFLCLLASLFQALVAVLVIFILRLVLDATSFVITDTARVLEIGSYTVIAILGLYLIWRSLKPVFSNHSHSITQTSHDSCGCGHTHAPSIEQVRQKGVYAAAVAVISVGMRPCSGAIIVLSFALAQGLFWTGVMSVFAMGLGTALTVITLMLLAVSVRSLTLFSGRRIRKWTMCLLTLFQLIAAFIVFLFGFILLSASVQNFL